jgi:hypothetical protein
MSISVIRALRPSRPVPKIQTFEKFERGRAATKSLHFSSFGLGIRTQRVDGR